MHATTSELIARRDGEPLDAKTAMHIDECVDCRRELERLEKIRSALREIPEEQPPMDAWQRIMAARELEQPHMSARHWLSGAPMALAASLLAAVFSVLIVTQVHEPLPVIAGNGSQGASQVAGSGGKVSLASLQEQSGYLEQMLGVVQRSSGSVTSLQTADTVAELQDGIAMIDYRLGQAERYPLTEAERQELWQRRVELLESLVTVRYAQARANSI